MSVQKIGIIPEQKQITRLAGTQLQSLEILQMSSIELEEIIQNTLLENPMLEMDESSDEYGSEQVLSTEHIREQLADEAFDRYDDRWYDSWDGSSTITDRRSAEKSANEFERFMHSEVTFHEHLLNQLLGTKCSEQVREIAELIIFSLDDDGMLDESVWELSEINLASEGDIAEAFSIVRSFDPAGIAETTLQDCLKAQLDEKDPLYRATCEVIDRELDCIARQDFVSLARKYSISLDEAKEICSKIKTLNPRPGRSFSDGKAVHYIAPDVIAMIEGDEIVPEVCGRGTKLVISELYKQLLRTSKDEAVKNYLKEKLESAAKFLEFIERRRSTLLSVANEVLKRQADYIISKDKEIKPLTMQEVADALSIHVSTVSRAVSNKYISIENRIYPLKYFFSSDINGTSRISVEEEIKKLIEGEDPGKPLSDQKITEILKKKGYDISRRTVAKYRDRLGIPPKTMRGSKI